MKKIILLITTLISYSIFLPAQTLSSFNILTSASILKPLPGNGYSLTQPLYNELIQPARISSAKKSADELSELKSHNEFNVYPNPVSDFILFHINSNNKGIYHIELYNSLMVKVMHNASFLYELNNRELPIKISEIPAGIYFLKITYTESGKTQFEFIKIIKQ